MFVEDLTDVPLYSLTKILFWLCVHVWLCVHGAGVRGQNGMSALLELES